MENLPAFQQMTAITFNDVVVSHEAFSNGLLFHELVHVEQYRRWGAPVSLTTTSAASWREADTVAYYLKATHATWAVALRPIQTMRSL
ncbi:MAG: hypothetical protein WA715_15240 [Candidatus Acidiferrum sp.]|jgi:hypothetical protein